MSMIKKFIEDWKVYSNEENFLIYQMGKVGSTSLEVSIKNSIHFHSLYGNWPCHVQHEQMRGKFLKGLAQNIYDIMRRRAIRSHKKIKIITLVRDPYPRNISTFFQHFPHWMYKYYTMGRYSKYEYFSTLFSAFDKAMDHSYPLTWFDNEFKKFTGIDVYSQPFDKNVGYCRIQNKKYDILVLKLEAMEKNWEVVENFVGQKVELTNANVSTDKWYNDIYRTFMKTYSPSTEYLNLLYNSKLVKHFYTDVEISKFRKKWENEEIAQ